MRFRNFVENLLGSKVKIKLLRYLISEESVTSEREIAKLIGVSHSAVNKTLKEFHELNLISPLRVGNVIIWQLNKESYAYKFLSNFFNEIKRSPIEHLKSTIESSLGYLTKIKKVVIFGSVAEGRELPSSDIDVFILVENEEARKKILSPLSSLTERCIRLYGNKLSPNIFTYRDLTNPKNKKFLENVKKGIVVIER